MPPFTLSPWELPSESPIARSTPATARTPARFLGKEQMVLVRRLEFGGTSVVILVRGEGDGDEASWTPLRRFDAKEMPWPLHQPLDEWADVREESDYGRIVWFQGAMAALHPDGRAHWRVPGEPEEVPFRWHDGTRDWTTLAVSQWKMALEAELHDSESDASFAHRWAFLSEERRRELVWECEPGWSEFYALLGWMLTAQPDLEMEQRYAIQVLCLNSHNDYLGLEFWFNEWVGDDYADKRVEWIVDWENTINGLFSIRPRRELILRYSCANAEFPLDHGHGLLVERGPISYHERGEALLQLNEWARPRGVQMLSGQSERFDLAEWELSPTSPETREGMATAWMRAEWLGEEREFWLRQVEMGPEWFVVFARTCDGSAPDNFALCGNFAEGDWPLTARVGKSIELAPLWCDFAGYSRLARLFFLDFSRWGGSGVGAITLHANGQGHLEQGEDDATFRWNADGLGDASSGDWLARLEEELSDANSDAFFALRWLRFPHEERLAHIFRCKRGTLAELHEVLEWAMKCAPTLAAKSTQLKSSRQESRLWRWNAWPTEKFADVYDLRPRTVPHHLKAWGTAIVNWFQPWCDEKFMQEHCFADNFYQCYEERLLEVVIAPLTAPEMDKARCLLREWAPGKVPDELLETLA